MKTRAFLSIQELGIEIDEQGEKSTVSIQDFIDDSLEGMCKETAPTYLKVFKEFCTKLSGFSDSKTPWTVGKTYLDSASNEVRIIADSGKANFNGNHYPLIGEIKIDENYYVIGYYSQSGESVIEGPESQSLTLVEKPVS